MSRPVIAIIGAGASHVSGRYAESWRPPLTKQLFDRGPSRDLLKQYTLAQAASSVIGREMKADTTMAFEEALRRLQNDGYEHHRQMALAVPPFLQALLLHYSATLRAESSRYGVLVDELLKLDTNVCFVSLNYDTLLDNHLAAFSPLGSMDNYINTPLGWSLIKPHGSVAWFVEQAESFDPKTPPGNLTLIEAPIECVPTSAFDLSQVRGAHGDPHGVTRSYPAIALPDGPKDRLVLPHEHLNHLTRVLATSPEIDMLVLGYSALDTEILALVQRGGCRVRRMTVVNADASAALNVFNTISTFGIEPIWADVFDGSYEEWIDDDGLRRWVDEYAGPFSSIIPVDEVQRRIAERAVRAGLEEQPAESDIMTRPM